MKLSKQNCIKTVIAIKLDAEHTTLLNSCIKFYMFTNISYIDTCTKYATLTDSVKCNLNGMHLEIIS